MGYDICRWCARPTHRCECAERGNIPAGVKESYSAAEFVACLRHVSRPSGLLLGAMRVGPRGGYASEGEAEDAAIGACVCSDFIILGVRTDANGGRPMTQPSPTGRKTL